MVCSGSFLLQIDHFRFTDPTYLDEIRNECLGASDICEFMVDNSCDCEGEAYYALQNRREDSP